MTSPRFRTAGPEDADRVAWLHADSWRRNYRGFYTDAYLDGPVLDDRITAWRAKLAAPAPTSAPAPAPAPAPTSTPTPAPTSAATWTLLAEDDDARLLAFVHVEFDLDEQWGSLVDNLHVAHGRQRSGIGRTLLRRAADAVLEQAAAKSMYLWVLEQNIRAQEFYRACGGAFVERIPVGNSRAPGLVIGEPNKLRVAWSDPSIL